MDEALLEIVKAIKDLSPQLWAIVLKQVYIHAYANLIGSGLVALMAVPFSLAVRKGYKMKEESPFSDYEHWMIIGWMGLTVSLLIAIMLLPDGLMKLANPEFYAIQYLLRVVR